MPCLLPHNPGFSVSRGWHPRMRLLRPVSHHAPGQRPHVTQERTRCPPPPPLPPTLCPPASGKQPWLTAHF
uniref:Uncharacterized protein n=1 Tax=Anguilla anguilla TaxID=7936 RepID=A0A0E9W9P0_ANGAN